jgi:hypothetical protein
MRSQLLINPDKLAIVRLGTGEYCVRLALQLTREFTGGDLVQFAHDATGFVEGADELASSYNRTNWMSGITSGALYAFRALRIPRQYVVLTELAGRLRASDMEVLANSSAIGIAKLADKELPALHTDGWTIHTEISDRILTTSIQSSQGKLIQTTDTRIEKNGGNGEIQKIPVEQAAATDQPHN